MGEESSEALSKDMKWGKILKPVPFSCNGITDGPQFMMVRLKIFQLYDVTKTICIYYKLYFEIWMLVFSWSSDMGYNTLVMLGSCSELQLLVRHMIMRVNNWYSLTVYCVASIFWILCFYIGHVYKMLIFVSCLWWEEGGRQLLLRRSASYCPSVG